MRAKLRNKYFILRHGQTIHQTEKRGIIYGWPDDNSPCGLTEYGREQIKKVAKKLKGKIDLIFSSDTLRTRQTAEIVAKKLGLKPKYDLRLRDNNWGIFQGKTKEEGWEYYKEMKEKFKKAPPKGESWSEVRKRMVNFLKEIEKKYKNRTILIVSHGDPLWLLEGWARGLNNKELLKQKKNHLTIKTGELHQLR